MQNAIDTQQKFHHSFSGWCSLKLFNWEYDYSSTTEMVAKTAVAEVGYVLLTLVGAVETVARAILVLLSCAVDVFVPESASLWYDEKICLPLIDSMILTGLQTASAAIQIVANFAPKETATSLFHQWSKPNRYHLIC